MLGFRTIRLTLARVFHKLADVIEPPPQESGNSPDIPEEPENEPEAEAEAPPGELPGELPEGNEVEVLFIARKVSLAKWNKKTGLTEKEIAADAVTVDLKTTSNTLSFWECGKAESAALDCAALALASGFQRLDKLDLIWVDSSALRAGGIELETTPGRCHYKPAINLHMDAIRLDSLRLVKVAEFMATAVASSKQELDKKNKNKKAKESEEGKKNKYFKRYTRTQVKNLLIRAIKAEEIDLEDLDKGLQEKLK